MPPGTTRSFLSYFWFPLCDDHYIYLPAQCAAIEQHGTAGLLLTEGPSIHQCSSPAERLAVDIPLPTRPFPAAAGARLHPRQNQPLHLTDPKRLPPHAGAASGARLLLPPHPPCHCRRLRRRRRAVTAGAAPSQPVQQPQPLLHPQSLCSRCASEITARTLSSGSSRSRSGLKASLGPSPSSPRKLLTTESPSPLRS